MTEGKIFYKERYFRETGYVPHDAQMQIHRTKARHKAISNGRRWGKTLLGAKEAEATAWVRNFLDDPQRGWIVGPNYTDCEKEFRFVYNSLKALGVDDLSSRFVNNPDSGNMHITTNWGWDLQCRSAQYPDSLVGEGLDFVLMVEAGRLRRKIFTSYIRPALSDKKGWSLMTGVPEIATDISLLYWGWKRGQDSEKRFWRSWRMPSWTNTIVFPGGRTDEEILEAEDELTEDEFARQYGGFFVEKIGRVMAEWDDEEHLTNLKFNPNWPLYAAVDYGYTNPFVWLWLQTDQYGNTYVLGEHYITYQDTSYIAEHTLKDHPWLKHLVAFYPDPARPDDTSTLERILQKPARTNTGGELKTRLELTRQRLRPGPLYSADGSRRPRLLVDHSCTKLAWEMREGYRWPEKKDDAPRNDAEVPQDKDNHGPEALGRFMKGYFDVATSEQQTSRQGKMRVRRRRAA